MYKNYSDCKDKNMNVWCGNECYSIYYIIYSAINYNILACIVIFLLLLLEVVVVHSLLIYNKM